MVRRGSPVRVRKRALQKRRISVSFLSAQPADPQCAVSMAPQVQEAPVIRHSSDSCFFVSRNVHGRHDVRLRVPIENAAQPPYAAEQLKPVGAEKRGSQRLRGLHVHLLFHARARISDRSEVGKQVGPWCVGSTGIVGNGSAHCGAKHQCVRSATVETTLTRARCSVYAAIA
jgi:hypothetical protein